MMKPRLVILFNGWMDVVLLHSLANKSMEEAAALELQRVQDTGTYRQNSEHGLRNSDGVWLSRRV